MRNGWLAPGTTAVIRGRRPACTPRPVTCPTSSSGSPPCWTGSGRPWTVPAPWPTPTPGTSSWRAPASRPSPRQALALTELAAHAATDPYAEPRAMLLAADDYSAVSGRVPLSNLYERGRSLGIAMQVSAQSWEGLGGTEDERYRIAATADGGIFVLHTPYPEPLIQLAGTRRVLETAHQLIGNRWGDEGTTRIQRAPAADPNLVRRL